MQINIRADILSSALYVVANTSGGRLDQRMAAADPENDWLTFDRLAREVPDISVELWNMTSKWEFEKNYPPITAFFSINPPGTLMRLRQLIGPDAEQDPWDLNSTLASEEALGVVLQRFLIEVEKQHDEWVSICNSH